MCPTVAHDRLVVLDVSKEGLVPEGHTIHRLAKDLGGLFQGQELVASSPQGRFDAGAARISGRTLTSTDAWGKHLFLEFAEEALGPDQLVHIHLGLYGSFRRGPGAAPTPQGAIRLRLVGDRGWAELRGATTCELLDPAGRDRLLLRLGPDPLRPGADVARVVDRFGKSRVAVAGVLMDQSVLAGVGNAFRAELLFRHRIDPFLPAAALPRASVEALWFDLVTLMRLGVRNDRMITTRPEHRDKPKGTVNPGDQYYVYRRAGEPCRVCGALVAKEEFQTRSLYWCSTCQPEGSGSTPRE